MPYILCLGLIELMSYKIFELYNLCATCVMFRTNRTRVLYNELWTYRMYSLFRTYRKYDLNVVF